MTTKRLMVALACTVAVLGASMPTAAAQEPPDVVLLSKCPFSGV